MEPERFKRTVKAYSSQHATSGGNEDKHSDETETLHDESGIFRAGFIDRIYLDD